MWFDTSWLFSLGLCNKSGLQSNPPSIPVQNIVIICQTGEIKSQMYQTIYIYYTFYQRPEIYGVVGGDHLSDTAFRL